MKSFSTLNHYTNYRINKLGVWKGISELPIVEVPRAFLSSETEFAGHAAAFSPDCGMSPFTLQARPVVGGAEALLPGVRRRGVTSR